MPEDEGDLLGGLPRKRPGTRSTRRQAGVKPPAKKPASPSRPPPPPPPEGPLNPVLRAAASGLRLGTGLTRGVLRRLPRP